MFRQDLDPIREIISRSGLQSNYKLDGGNYIFGELHEEALHRAHIKKGVILRKLDYLHPPPGDAGF